jgi:prevent-host-death family protein
MSNRNPETETITLPDLQRDAQALLTRVARHETRVVVEQDGAPAAAIVSVRDLERLTRFEEQIAERQALLEEARALFKSVPYEEVEREVEKALAEVRAEASAGRAASVLVARDGVPIAAFIPVEKLAGLNQFDKQWAEDWALLDEIREAFKDVSPEELEREAERALAEVRAEMRAERERAGATRS